MDRAVQPAERDVRLGQQRYQVGVDGDGRVRRKRCGHDRFKAVLSYELAPVK